MINLINNLKKKFPIYINTLNIFRPLRTWYHNKNIARFPNIDFTYDICSFQCLEDYIYTWYWWDHRWMFDFPNKWLFILIDDVQYKYTYGIRQLESVPFIIIRIFNLTLVWKFIAPKHENNYEYWERLEPTYTS